MTDLDDRLHSKDTRWDRIRKRHLNANNVRTEAVKKFIEMDFIGKNNLKVLNGEKNSVPLNPALVMNLRHEMIKRFPKKPYVKPVLKEINEQKVKNHNKSVENHYIEHELKKFRDRLQKARMSNEYKVEKPKPFLNINTKTVLQSFEKFAEHIEDFYNAPIEGIVEMSAFYPPYNSKNQETLNTNMHTKEQHSIAHIPSKPSSEEKQEFAHKHVVTSHVDLTDKEILVLPEEVVEIPQQDVILSDLISTNLDNESTEEKNIVNKDIELSSVVGKPDDRCVHFYDSVEVIKFARQQSLCSNTSDGIDSVISDLADEVINEIEKEAKLELIEEDFQNLRKCEKLHLKGDSYVKPFGEDILTIRQISQTPCNKLNNTNTEVEDDASSSEIGSSEQNIIIEQLFRPKFPPDNILMRKYFLKWIHYTTIEKIEKQDLSNKNDRIHKINRFLDKIRLEKNRLPKSRENNDGSNNGNNNKKGDSIIMTKKYQNKIKIQQDIIDLQKMKLERQERMIMELKLGKLSEDARQARQEIKNELKEVIRTGNIKNQSKAKCLQLVGNLRDEDDDEFARLQGKSLMMPKFLEKMQERALERSIKHEQAKKRRLAQEAEREAAKMAAEEARRLEDEAAKRDRIELLKEKRRQEKMAKILKEREHQRYLENVKKSQDFCRQRILRRIGMEGFKRMIKMKRTKLKNAENFRRRLIKKTMFTAWKEYYLEVWSRKVQLADTLCLKITIRTALRAWLLYVAEERSKYFVACDWYDLKLTECVFKRWCGYSKLQQIAERAKMKQAEMHHQWHLKWKVVDRWQRLPQILKLEKETDERRQRWRLKIWELLPDYTPNRDQLDFNFKYT